MKGISQAIILILVIVIAVSVAVGILLGVVPMGRNFNKVKLFEVLGTPSIYHLNSTHTVVEMTIKNDGTVDLTVFDVTVKAADGSAYTLVPYEYRTKDNASWIPVGSDGKVVIPHGEFYTIKFIINQPIQFGDLLSIQGTLRTDAGSQVITLTVVESY